MKTRLTVSGLLLTAVLLVAGCGSSPKNNGVWDIYAMPSGSTAPYDNDYYYRAPSTGTDQARRCNSIGDMPSCGGD